MCFTHVSDPGDPRLADYLSLTDVELRKSLEAEHGLFMAEGEKVIRRAVAGGYRVRSMLATEQKATALADLAAVCDGPAYVLPAPVAEQLTGYHVHRGVLAAMDRRPLPSVAGVLAEARSALILEDIVDHTNVGAIFRCAAALGVGAVVVSPRCADPLYRRSVKVSMGAVFAVPWARMTDWYGGLATVRAAGFRLLALTPDPAAAPLEEADGPAKRIALLLGTEGDGLSSRWRHEADQAVRIPMDPGAQAAGVDSLNVVAAAAIACQWLAARTAQAGAELRNYPAKCDWPRVAKLKNNGLTLVGILFGKGHLPPLMPPSYRAVIRGAYAPNGRPVWAPGGAPTPPMARARKPARARGSNYSNLCATA